MVTVKLYVEGGGDVSALKAECRQSFSNFLSKAGFDGKKPRIVACGGRQNAYESYCTAVSNGEDAVLLVDSETEVSPQHEAGNPDTWQPWKHLKLREGDGWDKPDGVKDTDCHLMTQCIESWFLVDRKCLKDFFGQDFKAGKLPSVQNPSEKVRKAQVFQSLSEATKDCRTKSQYGKGQHSFKLLGALDPDVVMSGAPWAKRFVDELKKKMGGQEGA